MPELTISLADDLLQLLEQEAEHRQHTPSTLVESILTEHLKQRGTTITPQQTEPKPVSALIENLAADDPGQVVAARQELESRGQSVVAELEQAIPGASPWLLVELARVLSRLTPPVALRPLLWAYALGEASNKAALLHELKVCLHHYSFWPEPVWEVVRLCTPQTAPLVARQLKEFQGLAISPQDTLRSGKALTPEDIVSLVALLRWRRTGSTAQQIAYALTTTAMTAPLPELRQALPYLRPAWHNFLAPAEFLQAVRAIETATQHWAELPLPAESAPEDAEPTLPLPSVEPERQ